MEQLTAELGHALRRARLRRGLTLRQMAATSAGRYKPSSIAGYERGERQITVERFCRLAAFYGEDPGRLLTEAVEAASRAEPGEIVIDLTRLLVVLPDLDRDERTAMEHYVTDRGERIDEAPGVLRLDPDDLGSLAAEVGRTPEELLADLREAVRSEGSP
jgi:transcriptional regulator with XRE-family HTH domain